MTSSEIRSRFLAFFAKRGHAVIPSASLITPDEKGITNSTLFNTAGMQPLVPYLLGKPYLVAGKAVTRLVDSQKCLRTVDIDDVGDRVHNTFFEMLGNWSLGDYFKKEALAWSYEFLTNSPSLPTGDAGLGLDPNRLYVTVFEGDKNAPRDDEAAAIWRDIFKKNGVNEDRIFYLPADKNWWEAGDNGPCGPDSEMYYDVKNKFGGKPITREQFIAADADAVRDVVEVWNNVFMQYEKKDGKIIGKLPKPSVDTGAGLERSVMTSQGVDNIYETDLLKSILAVASKISDELKSQRIIADHMRAAVMLACDGVIPSNTDRGYILRRLIRRAVFNTTSKKMSVSDIATLVDVVVGVYQDTYKELAAKATNIKNILGEEVAKFEVALANGLKELNKLTSSTKVISAEAAFDLYQSYGFPVELTTEIAKERGLSVDKAGFDIEMKKHQDLSRAGAEKKFKGGLEGNEASGTGSTNTPDPMVVRYHTASHLLHQALRQVLGDKVMQKGSHITTERARFDFAHGAKMTDEEKKKVEDIVNAQITSKLPVNKIVLPLAEAEKTGALHYFDKKYGNEISVYFIGGEYNADTGEIKGAFSKEFCGGPHVANTSELAGPEGKWKFKIQKEEAVAQGVRRIKAVLG